MASVAFAKDQGPLGAVAVWAETSKSVGSLSATLDQEAAIAIYLAKASRTPRDSTSATLATRYNITMKAVRDVWTLRTWVWTTMPYWSGGDLKRFLGNHLCAECRKKGVKTLADACTRCAKLLYGTPDVT